MEVLLGHGTCHIIVETLVELDRSRVVDIVLRIAGDVAINYREVRQDSHLADNQANGIRCGDNGVFKGMLSVLLFISLTEFSQ